MGEPSARSPGPGPAGRCARVLKGSAAEASQPLEGRAGGGIWQTGVRACVRQSGAAAAVCRFAGAKALAGRCRPLAG